MTSQNLFKESSLTQTMPESPAQSYVIEPANPKAGCYLKVNCSIYLEPGVLVTNFVTNTGNIHLKRCIQSLEPIQSMAPQDVDVPVVPDFQSPNQAKKGPLPKLKIKRGQSGLISEMSQDPSTKSKKNDVISVGDVIDLCDDDEVETVSASIENLSLPEVQRRSLRQHRRPKRFEDYRTGNTPKRKIFKVSICFSVDLANN